MRVVLVNYRYLMSGGPERYMFSVTDLLEGAGHEVIPFSIRYRANRPSQWETYFAEPIGEDDEVLFRDQRQSPAVVVRGLRRAFYASDVYERVVELLRVARPDVALVQNYLRKLSPSVLVALKHARVPIVVRLSDFAMVCPEAHMLRNGRICRECLDHGLIRCIRHRCVQRSLGVSAIASLSMLYAKWRGYFDLIDYFIAPSATMKAAMSEGGFDPDRIVVLPTFVAPYATSDDAPCQRRIAFVGRLSHEKGVETLLQAHAKLIRSPGLGDVELWIAGSGAGTTASRALVASRNPSSRVRLLGELDSEGVRDVLHGSQLSVVPSLWLENLPNAMLESLSVGTPVVASDIGSLSDALDGTGAGLLFKCGDADQLADTLASVLCDADRLERMRIEARELAARRYSPEAHLHGLLRVMAAAKRRCDDTALRG